MTTRPPLLRLLALGVLVGSYLLSTPSRAAAQTDDSWSISLNGEVVSRYVWRGREYGIRPNVQPALTVSRGNLSFGTWGSYTANDEWREQDLFVSLVGATEAFEWSLTVYDYYFFMPGYDLGFLEYGGVVDGAATGAHTFELIGTLTGGPEALPLTLTAGWNFYNDPDHPIWLGLSAERAIGDWSVMAEIGYLATASPWWYETDEATWTELLLDVRRPLFDWGGLEIYGYTQAVYSPIAERTFFIAALGF
jgi:hypothetical protein